MGVFGALLVLTSIGGPDGPAGILSAVGLLGVVILAVVAVMMPLMFAAELRRIPSHIRLEGATVSVLFRRWHLDGRRDMVERIPVGAIVRFSPARWRYGGVGKGKYRHYTPAKVEYEAARPARGTRSARRTERQGIFLEDRHFQAVEELARRRRTVQPTDVL